MQTSQQVLDRHYLEIRCGLLDLAAARDRIERADGADAVAGDPRMALIRQAIDIVAGDGTNRAESLQILFSDAYEPGWNRQGRGSKS